MKVVKTAGYETRLGDLVRDARDLLRRRYLMLLAIAAVVTVIGVALTTRITPIYKGTARVQIDPSRNPLLRAQSEEQAQLANEAIETEVSAMSSGDLVRDVVKRLNLANDPEFVPAPASGKPPLTPEQKMAAAIGAVRGRVDASRERLTYVITVSFRSRDPGKAALVANTFAQAYLDKKVGDKIGTAERQSQWLQKRMDELANEIRQADERVAQYQAQSGIVRGAASQQGTIVDQQITPLSLQLAAAEATAAEARSKEQSARDQVRRGQLDAISDVRQSVTVQDLKRQEAMLQQTMEDMRSRYGPRHPDFIKTEEQLSAIRKLMRSEEVGVIGSLKANANAAEAQAGSLRGAIAKLEQKQGDNARASVIADSLQRDADSKHAAYDKMASQALESRQAAQNSIAQARIVDQADMPTAPSWPNRKLLYALSLMAGLGIGIAVIVTQEMMVTGLRSVDDVEEEVGVPLIAAIPQVGGKRPADIVVEKPTSQFAEALRNARASLIGVRGQARPKVIALTSALPGEGKTTTAFALARVMAMNGDRTIVIDTDVRRAQLRNIVETPMPRFGLVQYLHGEGSIEDAIEPSGTPNLDQILVTEPYFSSENLFGNDQMPDLLDKLSERYDAIILDLPPLIGLADGRFLAALADAVALVIRWNTTPKHAVATAAASLKADNANLVGTIFTMVDTNSNSIGAYYYSEQYSKYYQGE
ncbi:AAA family ATPase [uncultured Sphingomonas sp.]|mgnify:CR=1 FL=1|uniref:GumC family protein n=1 Tax=uncultured Sphingomonas sp. TaxID=158754 RepID=UPI0025EAB264|nr:AAA family ATPase [uncultured Sphingomonas sp.]